MEFIRAYTCLVYRWVTGPHEWCIDSTVPVMLANERATTLPLWADSARPTDAMNASQ